jgi:type II restriction endonuclease, putative
MNNDKKIIRTTKKIYPQIYSYILPDLPANKGWQKVGYTERKDVDSRILEQTKTAAVKLRYEKLWSASSFSNATHEFFKDKDLHKYYVKNGIEKSKKQDDGGLGEEWFYFNGTPEKSKELFDDYANGNLFSRSSEKSPYKLRKEQERAVSQTLSYAESHQTTDFSSPNKEAEFLWNAKPRFGKTLSSYDFAKKFNAKNVLIVTNRPAIANSWFDDFEKFIDGYYFISTADSLKERETLSREEFLNKANSSSEDRQITFLSLQDLKGGKAFGGPHNKLKWVADLKWDLLIIDEAHEGVDTDRTNEAFGKIKRRFTLHLSGTPFKAIADGHFKDNQIFNWTYIDEQKAKQEELKNLDDSGDHVNLPDMRLFTYKMSDIISDRLEKGMEMDDENIDYAFELNEMFSTDTNGKFVHENDISTFLNQLTSNEKYPFSTPELRDQLKHTFWLVGNRVASAKAMEKMLRHHPVFSEYKIVLAAGNGRVQSDSNSSEDEMKDTAANEKALSRVKKAIKENDRTITLSVGQLTTGVTIKEWSAVLMLSDIKSESLYMQAIFRSQNPYEFIDNNGNLCRKKSAYVFDFSPNRVLKVYDKFANSLLADVARGEATEKIREQNVAELLNYFPVLAEDESGKMIELDAEQVLIFPKAIVAKEVVNRGFVTNLLFVNINNVFNIPSEVIAALNKAPSTSDTDKQTKGEEVQHDPDRKKNRDHRISVNKDKLLGNKVYTSRMQDIVLSAVDSDMEADEIVEKITADCMPEISEVLGKYKDFYSPSKTELDNIKNGLREKVKEAAEEFVSGDIADRMAQDKLADSLANIIEKDLPNDTVIREEEDNYEKEEKSEMDQIRRKLRTFTRAIPSFIMAASKDVDEITLDNIEDTVSDKDFEELFTEKDSEPFTKDDFRKIRGPWTNPETGETFEGFFDRYTFNAAIREFEEKRQEIADYLSPGAKEDIFSYIRPLKTNQIFTPRGVVNKMLDLLEENNPGIFEDPNATFADLYVKSGLYLTEIAKRLNRGLESKIPDKSERVKHILEKQLYGFAPTNIIYNIARKYIYGTFSGIDDSNLKQLDLTDAFKKGETLNMKFTAVVGNPPYQGGQQGASHYALPVYHNFMSAAYAIADKAILITPARFLFNAGQTPKEWNEKMLNDEHLSVLEYYNDGKDIFPNTDIKGGVSITYRDTSKKFGTIKHFTIFPELNSILKKVSSYSVKKNVGDIIYVCSKFNLGALTSDYPEYQNRERRMSSNVLKLKMFNDDRQNISDITIYGVINNKRTIKYIKSEYVDCTAKNITKYKVILPKAEGSGKFGEIVTNPTVIAPQCGYTHTFYGIGAFENEEHAKNVLVYVKTKFARALLSVLKVTQNVNADTWRCVPLQDFTNNSDIDWSKSIEEVDKQLYKKYDLSDKEIAFIEEKVRPME